MQPQHVIDYIKSNYPKEGGAPIAKHLNMSYSLVYHYAKKMGLSIDKETKREIQRRKFNNMKSCDYNVNPDQFIEIQTANVAYLLGILWADGSIYHHPNPNKLKRRISLSLLTEDMMEIKKILDATGNWGLGHYHRTNRQPQSRAETSNLPLYNFLESCDYRSKSESPQKILNKIPDHLKHYWFRGLFDGDGHIDNGKSKRIVISSTYDQDWKYMEDLCRELQINGCRISRNIGKTSKNSSFSILNTDGIIKFCRYIYQGRTEEKMGFTRKYNKYEFLIAQNVKLGRPPKYHLKEVKSDPANGNLHVVRLITRIPLDIYHKIVKIDPLAHLTRGEKISLKRNIGVTCVNNGKSYKTALQAAEDTTVSRNSVDRVLKGKQLSVKGLMFVYTKNISTPLILRASTPDPVKEPRDKVGDCEEG